MKIDPKLNHYRIVAKIGEGGISKLPIIHHVVLASSKHE